MNYDYKLFFGSLLFCFLLAFILVGLIEIFA